MATHNSETSPTKTSPAEHSPTKTSSATTQWNFLTDMDGVLIQEDKPIDGAKDFLQELKDSGTHYMVLTNNSIFTPRDLAARLRLSYPALIFPPTIFGHRRWPPPHS